MAPSQPSDSKQLQEKIKLTREIAEVLRKNIVQAVKIEEARDPESFDRFSVCFRLKFDDRNPDDYVDVQSSTSQSTQSWAQMTP